MTRIPARKGRWHYKKELGKIHKTNKFHAAETLSEMILNFHTSPKFSLKQCGWVKVCSWRYVIKVKCKTEIQIDKDS